MAHELTVTNGRVEMFSGMGIVPWHGLGTIVEGRLNSEEAIVAAHMDWVVQKEPVYIRGDIAVPNHQALVRKDTSTPLAVVTDRYEILQNVEAFTALDSLFGLGLAVYETAGTLFGGRKVWIMASIPGNYFINGDDEHRKNVLLYTGHDGKTAVTIKVIKTRVVCNNTLSVALREGNQNSITITHRGDMQAKKQEAMKALGLINAYYDDLTVVMESLATKEMDGAGVDRFLGDLLPVAENTKATRTLNARDKIKNLFHNGAGNRGKTRYDAINAVTDFVDHEKSTRGENKQEARFNSAIFGSGSMLKQKALNLLTV